MFQIEIEIIIGGESRWKKILSCSPKILIKWVFIFHMILKESRVEEEQNTQVDSVLNKNSLLHLDYVTKWVRDKGVLHWISQTIGRENQMAKASVHEPEARKQSGCLKWSWCIRYLWHDYTVPEKKNNKKLSLCYGATEQYSSDIWREFFKSKM